MLMGIFSVSWYPFAKMTIILTWNWILNSECTAVEQLNGLGNSMYVGISISSRQSPSAT